jgi:predicted HTH transcriptional regulator
MEPEAKIFPERGSKTLEFKSIIPDFEKLVKTCIAFANGNGGQILIGIQDGSREIIGTTDKERDRLYDEFPNSLYDSVNSTLLSQIYEKRICGKSVLVIHILPSPKKPCFLKKKDSQKASIFELDLIQDALIKNTLKI